MLANPLIPSVAEGTRTTVAGPWRRHGAHVRMTVVRMAERETIRKQWRDANSLVVPVRHRFHSRKHFHTADGEDLGKAVIPRHGENFRGKHAEHRKGSDGHEPCRGHCRA